MGLALHSDAFAYMWVLNQLYVIGERPALEAAALVAELDRLHGHRTHRRVVVEDDATGARLAEGMRAAGFTVERMAMMPLEEPVAAPVPEGFAIEEVGEERFRAAERAGAVDAETRFGEPDELVAGWAQLRSRPGTRRFVGVRDGVDACTVTLYSDGAVGQPESVTTLSSYRGQGLAGAVVSHAAQEALSAGDDLVWIICEAEGGPLPLYERLGFRARAQFWVFTRPA